jgi:hypothetical protein
MNDNSCRHCGQLPHVDRVLVVENGHASDYAKGYNQAIKEVKELCRESITLYASLEALEYKFPRLAE